MSRIARGFATTTLGLFGLAATAAAAVPGYTLPEANLRAGPGRDYPLISLVPPGRTVEIFGCIGGYGWCDVDVDGTRGFISGRKLQILYRDRRVGLSYYGPRLELPVIQFDIGTYWSQYYPSRPFYAERFRWQHGPDVGHSYGGPPPSPRPDADHGYAAPPPRPEPEHGNADYNRPAPPVRPASGHDQESAAAHGAPSDHQDHRQATPPETSQRSATEPGPSHSAPSVRPPGSTSKAPASVPNGTAPSSDHTHSTHAPAPPGQPPQ